MENPLPNLDDTNRTFLSFATYFNQIRELILQYIDAIKETRNTGDQSFEEMDLEEMEFFLKDIEFLFSDVSDKWQALKEHLQTLHRHWQQVAPKTEEKKDVINNTMTVRRRHRY